MRAILYAACFLQACSLAAAIECAAEPPSGVQMPSALMASWTGPFSWGGLTGQTTNVFYTNRLMQYAKARSGGVLVPVTLTYCLMGVTNVTYQSRTLWSLDLHTDVILDRPEHQCMTFEVYNSGNTSQSWQGTTTYGCPSVFPRENATDLNITSVVYDRYVAPANGAATAGAGAGVWAATALAVLLAAVPALTWLQ